MSDKLGFFPQLKSNFQNSMLQYGGFDPNEQITEEEKRRRANIGLQNLSDSLYLRAAQIEGNPQQVSLAQKQIAQRKLNQENAKKKAEQDQLIASMSPDQQQIYKTFGPSAAFQYQQNLQSGEIRGLQEQRKIQSLTSFGYTPEQANAIVVGGLKPEEVQTLNQPTGQSLDEIKNNVNLERSSVDEVTGKAPADDLANLDEAHGSILLGGDAFQENVINTVGRKLFGSEPADETGAAVRAKTELDERILQITTQNYSGRPSVFLLEQIKRLIPPVNTSDKDAFESYSKIETRVRGYLQDLEREIQSGQFKGDKLELMKSDFRQLYGLQQDLETAKKGLGDFQADIKPNLDNQSSGSYDNVYLNDNK